MRINKRKKILVNVTLQDLKNSIEEQQKLFARAISR